MWHDLTRCPVYSVSYYHAKADTKINSSKKEGKKITFFFNTVEQATGALTVIEAVSQLQSVNPECFPGKLNHSSHPGGKARLCNPTSAHAGYAGATAHPGRRAALPAALPHPRDLLHVPSPAYFAPVLEQECMLALCPKLNRKAFHSATFFFFF